MKPLNRVFLINLFVLPMLVASPGWAQSQSPTQKPDQKTAATPGASAMERNIQGYIELLRADVRQQKSEMMGAVMLLSAEDAARFWPIYSEYDAELARVNDQRVANIEEYARTYNQMTDEKADELIYSAFAYQKQRSELLAKAYECVKDVLGATTAARFDQVEDQLLLIIDLQIASSLPIVGQGS